VRVHTYLEGDNEVTARRYVCQVSARGARAITSFGRRYGTRLFDEACTGEGATFTNRYWIEPGGTVRRARQWVSEEVGFVVAELLTDG
jgi:hypothetical protein